MKLRCIEFSLWALTLLSSCFPMPLHAATRTWIGGNSDWVDAGSTANWTPADEPDADDTAVFNTANSVDLGSNNSILALDLSGGIDLSTNDNDLTVEGLISVSGAGTNLFVGGAASTVQAENLTISGGAVELRGGELGVAVPGFIGNGVVTINAGGTLSGNGAIILDGPLVAATVLNNNGTLTALSRATSALLPPPTGTLSITGGVLGARIDLDGTGEAGIVNVNRNQTLDIDIAPADSFNGQLNLFHNTSFDMFFDWSLAAGGTINVDNGTIVGIPGVPAGTATIAGGALTQSGGTINVMDADGTLQFDAPLTSNSGTFINSGHVIFNASSAINLANFDFDAGEWTVQNNALLSINVGDYDPGVVNNSFDSVMTLNNGDISVLTGDPKFVMNGTLNMSSTSGITVWDGEPLDIGNDAAGEAFLNVTGTATSRFASPVTFKSDAVVNVAGGATLSFNNTVNFDSVNGGSSADFTGSGLMSFNGAVNVNEATTLDMVGGTVDLDGNDSTGNLIFLDAPLEIHAQTLSPFGRTNNSGGANRITIDALNGTGALTVVLDDPVDSWTLNPEGEISILSTNAGFTLLAGNDMNLNGIVSVTGSVFSAAQLNIGGTVTLNTASEGLIFQGGNLIDTNRIAGGTIGGQGALGALNNRALVGFGIINADIDFEGTAQLLADDGTLNLGGDIVDVGTIGTADEDGVLNITNPWNSSSATTVSLKGGQLAGATLTVGNPQGIFGRGQISARVIVDSQISAATGTLVVETPGNDNDWDGAGNTGTLKAEFGSTLELRDVGAAFGFGGSVVATDGSTVFANGFALDFNPGSSLHLNGSNYRSTSSTDIGGTVTVAAGSSTIEVTNNFFLTFESTSSTTLNGNLTLLNNNINIEQGAVFNNGGGALIIPDGSHLVADNLADIDVLLDMQGTFRPGGIDSTGRIDLLDYQQENTGELFVELTGTALNAFDRLVLSGDAVLDGYLNIDIDGGFVPMLGNTFNIITGNTVSGTFDFADVSGMPAGLAFHIAYLPNAVQLQVVNKPNFSADFDDDGDVDSTDLAIWKGAYNLNQLGDADGDNDSDGEDFLLWQRQFGSAPLAAIVTAVPEPGAAGMLILHVFVWVSSIRRR